jgi:hypothetical protein
MVVALFFAMKKIPQLLIRFQKLAQKLEQASFLEAKKNSFQPRFSSF